MKYKKYLCLMIFVIGCSTARTVSIRPGLGGIIAVQPSQSEEARQKAQNLMTQNCGSKKVKITEEGEVAVGNVTSGRSTTSPSTMVNLFSGKKKSVMKTTEYSTTHETTEWRITYQCR